MKNAKGNFRSFFCFFIFVFTITYGQRSNTDSLRKIVKTAKEDTNKVHALNRLSSALYFVNPDSTILLAKEAAQLAQKKKFKSGEASAFHNLGIGFFIKGDYPNSLESYIKALSIREVLGNKKEMGSDLGNIALIYSDQGDYPKAIEYNLKALKIAEEIGNRKLQGNTYGNLGSVYKSQKNYTKALEYYLLAVKIDEDLGLKQSLASTLSNIAVVYNDTKNFSKAFEFYNRALKLDEELGNENEKSINYMNMGILFYDQKDYSKALEYYLKSLAINEKMGNKSYIAIGHANLGSVYIEMNKSAEAEKHLLEALRLVKEIESLDDQRQVEELLSKLYEKTGRDKLALKAYKNSMLLKDSIYNEEKDKEITRKEMNFEFERKEAKSKADQEKKDVLTAEEKQKQKIVIFAVAGILLVVIIFSLFLFNRFRITQKQKLVIEEQKVLVDKAYEKLNEKNKEVIDSIHYAKRIQTALIPSEKYIDKELRKLRKN